MPLINPSSRYREQALDGATNETVSVTLLDLRLPVGSVKTGDPLA